VGIKIEKDKGKDKFNRAMKNLMKIKERKKKKKKRASYSSINNEKRNY